MPKGPKGEKRPADVVGRAVKVAKIATGEIEDDHYVAKGRKKSGQAGAQARAKRLSSEERKKIAQTAAASRWKEKKEGPMSEKQRLLRTLFESQGREHLNIKFCRGPSDKTTPDDLCREVNTAIFQAEAGLIEPKPGFGDGDRKVVELKELLA